MWGLLGFGVYLWLVCVTHINPIQYLDISKPPPQNTTTIHVLTHLPTPAPTTLAQTTTPLPTAPRGGSGGSGHALVCLGAAVLEGEKVPDEGEHVHEDLREGGAGLVYVFFGEGGG